MGRVENELVAVVRTAVVSDFSRVEYPDGGGRGDEGQSLFDSSRWYRVVVEVEADVNSLAGLDRKNQVGLEGMGRQRQETVAFFLESLLDGLGIISWPWACMGHLVTPNQGLTVEVVQGRESTGGEEGFADVADGSFDAAFLVSRAHLARARCTVVVGAQV